MERSVALHQARVYSVTTEVYQGPLDLLLQLIERAELDITRLALAQVTDQYLEHLNQIQEQSAEEVSAFLVIASRLLQIKSEALLPRPPVRQEGEEDPGEALARQLRIYKRYKEIALLLAEREAAGLHNYLRLAPPPKVEVSLDLSGLGLQDLLLAACTIFASRDELPSLGTIVQAPRITIREKIVLIADSLRQYRRATFRDFLTDQRSNLDIVVTFLAMLELIKRQLIEVRQDSLFGAIEILPSGDWDGEAAFELEFGE